jgi:predicted Zn-dependent peptidase
MLQVSADELLEIANKYLNPEDMITLVVGKANHVNE